MSSSSKGIVMVNVVGTNPNNRTQKPVNVRFTRDGHLIGAVGVGSEAVANFGDGAGSAVPDFPITQYQAAQAANDMEAVSKILIAHAEMVKAAKAQGGGSEELQIAKGVCEYLWTHEGFLKEDGDGFVLKLENLDVQRNTLPADEGDLFIVAGTAVFGR